MLIAVLVVNFGCNILLESHRATTTAEHVVLLLLFTDVAVDVSIDDQMKSENVDESVVQKSNTTDIEKSENTESEKKLFKSKDFE